MIGTHRVLAVITARGGSKGVPGKNLRTVRGKPLIAWTVEAARASRYIDRLILSTDDEGIAAAATAAGCEVPFKRPAALADDHASSIEVILHALEQCPGFDWVVLLQPTSPLRDTQDIDGAIARCVEAGAPACVSVTEAEQSPYWMYRLDAAQRLEPLLPDRERYTRRQDLPSVYALNGAVYVARCDWLQTHRGFLGPETVAYPMPQQRSLDIDTELDFLLLDKLLSDSPRA